MSVLDAMQKAAIRLVGRKPQSFFGVDNGFELELTDLVNEVAADIAAYRDWQGLIRTVTLGGNGEVTDYPLPADYERMLLFAEPDDQDRWFWGYQAFTDIHEYFRAKESGFYARGGWIIFEDQLHFAPAPATGSQTLFPYITKNWAARGGVPRADFGADGDEFLLPERLLTLGLVWRWREQKKLDASGDQEAFIMALEQYATKDTGTKVYRNRPRVSFPGTYLAWPGELG